LSNQRDACSRRWARAWAVLACIALAGCTQVRIIEGGKTSVSYRFGVLRLQPDPNAPLLAVETTGVGVVPVAYGTAVGWTRQLLIASADPRRCQLILVIHSTEEAQAIRQQLQQGGGSLEHICVVNAHQGG
jgi:hypothetical protein